tara:strand:- start:1817 stop:2599 length:783 start_codon:yes stop_codon:yes gene_type:complete
MTGFRTFTMENTPVFQLDSAPTLNAFTREMLDGLTAFVDDAEANDSAVAVITSVGDHAFSAGTDLRESSTLTTTENIRKTDLARSLFFRIHKSPVVFIAAINGLAFGGGFELALACHLRVAAAHSRFALPEIKLALLPAYGGTQMLPALIGKAAALDLMLTGRTLTVGEADTMGLVSRIAPDADQARDMAYALSAEIEGHGRTAVHQLRRAIDCAGPDVTAAGLAVEKDAVTAAGASPDAAEGIRAFLDKRKPEFGRPPV